MRLYYHGDSDSLFWAEPGSLSDPLVDDVTHDAYMRTVANDRGIKTPDKITPGPEFGPKGDQTKAPTTGMAAAIVKSYKKWVRKPADLYPTPVDATESIIPLIEALGVKTVWEPACGDGRLSRVLEWHGLEVTSTDIREYPGYGEGGVDFLDPNAGYYQGKEFDAIITNPPFSLAEEFVVQALKFSPVVIMLVKQQYWNTKGRVPLFRLTQPNMFLPITWRLAFLKEERGNSPLMDCAWCIWVRDNTDHCRFDPIVKRVYPGYPRIGIEAATQVLEGEIDALAKALSGFRG